MPYIPQVRRMAISLSGEKPETPGELNYAITMLCTDYADVVGREATYQDLNDVIGALEAAKLEFYRRKVVPYEDSKIEENGDLS